MVRINIFGGLSSRGRRRNTEGTDDNASTLFGSEESIPDTIADKKTPEKTFVKSAGLTPDLKIYPLPSHDGIWVKIQPPRQPESRKLDHVPCDIVLAIDVSGSMGVDAPVPANPGERKERYGLSVLDLTKHAARTILETLNENDRLGIVTFATAARVVQRLTPMTKENKEKTKKAIENMRTIDATNLWHGILEGLKLFSSDGNGPNGKVPALMVLTDGQPNHMCPAQGYVPKLRSMERLPATIHTFGFGYDLRSGLLKSIAEIGGGNYSFIPDAGMIGTVFVHAVANLQSTFANNAVLRLTYPKYLELSETTGEANGKQKPVQLEGDGPDSPTQLTIQLSNMQFGQSRDIFLKYGPGLKDAVLSSLAEKCPPVINALLEYQHLSHPVYKVVERESALARGEFDPAEAAYHVSRSAIVSFLSALYPLRADEEHSHLRDLSAENMTRLLEDLIKDLPANEYKFKDDPACKSLVEDLCGTEPKGQITLALSKQEFYNKWGCHYLPSLAGAHARQICNSFKDPGPLMYGADSPLFKACRDKLDAAFDAIPAPKPSIQTGYKGQIRMSSYNRSSNPCFAGCTQILLAADAGKQEGRVITVGRLRAGMRVETPKGARRVVAVLKTPVTQEQMCLVGSGLLVTPHHPVSLDGKGWTFPRDIAERSVRYTGSIYSVLLERDVEVDAHAIMVGGIWGVTLGHGLTQTRTRRKDVRAHQFLGNYDLVIKALAGLHRSRSGLVLGGGVQRNAETGLVDGFKRATGPMVDNVKVAHGLLQRKVVHA